MDKNIQELLTQLNEQRNVTASRSLDLHLELIKFKLQNLHDCIIIPPKNTGDTWTTWIDLNNAPPMKVTALTKTDLKIKLNNYYFPTDRPTLEELFPLWIIHCKKRNQNDRTITKSVHMWNKYYCCNAIVEIPIDKLNTSEITEFFHTLINMHCLSRRAQNEVKRILKQLIHFSFYMNHIQSDIFRSIINSFQEGKPNMVKSVPSMIYTLEEKKLVFNEIEKDLYFHPNKTDGYGLILLFSLGVQLRELAAIRDCDIDYKNKTLYIHRFESNEMINGESSSVVISYVDKRNKHACRVLPLTNYEISIFRKVIQINQYYGYKDKDYIFLNKNGRTKARRFQYYFHKLHTSAGIKVKTISSVCVRRTVAADLFEKGISPNNIRLFLGYTNISTVTRSINSQTKLPNIME